MSETTNALDVLKASPKVQELQALIDQFMTDPDFLSDDKRVEKATKGFQVMDLSDRVIKQIRTRVEKDLYAELAQGKRKAVTEDDIKAEVKKGYQKHLDRKKGQKVDRSFIEAVKQ